MEERLINKDEKANNEYKKNNNNNEKKSDNKEEGNKRDIKFEENKINDKSKDEHTKKINECSQEEDLNLINQIAINKISFNFSSFSISHNEDKEYLFTPPVSEIQGNNKSTVFYESDDLYDEPKNTNINLNEIEEGK